MTGKKRERLDIIIDMLSAIQDRGEIKPTHLMYRSNLAHTQMKSYLEDLLAKNFIERVPRKGFTYIILTQEGAHFLQKIKEVREFEKTFGL